MSNSTEELMIPTRTKKVKLISECENEDRLSDLPESVILRILSFLNAKHAVQTCVLSSTYKNLWKRLPSLTLHSTDFQTYKIFTKFVSKILSLRDSSISVQTLDFKRNNANLEPHILKSIVNYAISHNVQQLDLNVTSDIAQIPPNLFSSQTLTHLKLSIHSYHRNMFPKYLNLPGLTSLQLGHFVFCVGDNDCAAEPFSTFSKLNSLLISDCTVMGEQTLCISSATLVNLTMYDPRGHHHKIDLCTPSLSTFTFCGIPYQKISGSNISSLEHVDIHAEVISPSTMPSLVLLGWLLEFADIKSLTLTASALQVLNLIPDLSKNKLPSLGNLKSLKVEIDEIRYGIRLTLCNDKLKTVTSKRVAARIRKAFKSGLEPSPVVPDGIVDFLRQNSPSAKVDFVDCTKKPPRPGFL